MCPCFKGFGANDFGEDVHLGGGKGIADTCCDPSKLDKTTPGSSVHGNSSQKGGGLFVLFPAGAINSKLAA